MFFHYVNKPIIYPNDDPSKITIKDKNYFDVEYTMGLATDIIKDSIIEKDRKIKLGLIDSIMMRYLIHIVGDIHQPLHTTSYYSYSKFDGKIIDGD